MQLIYICNNSWRERERERFIRNRERERERERDLLGTISITGWSGHIAQQKE